MAFADDVRLVARILDGKPGALEEFIRAYRPFVYAIFTRHLNLSREDADEVFQLFLIHLWERDFRRLRTWRGAAPLTSYLGKMARNLGRDYRRRAHLQRRIAEAAPSPARDTQSQAAGKERIELALSRLSQRDRDLIRRRYYQGQTYREIAAELHMTTNRAGVALSRALQRLKRILAGM
jgi:RNA polymerase sigma-70 factor (ECF subfamily)